MCQSSKRLDFETFEFITAMIKAADTFNSFLTSNFKYLDFI